VRPGLTIGYCGKLGPVVLVLIVLSSSNTVIAITEHLFANI